MNNLLGYAIDFASFLIQSLQPNELRQVKSILLFGSVARGTARRESDVDIFIDTTRKGLERQVERAVRRFAEGERGRYWKLMGVQNPIRCVAGRLEEWELRPSVVADGIVLYGKYRDAFRGPAAVLFTWNPIRPETKRVLLSKKLFGYTYHGKRYAGFSGAGIEKLGSGCLLVPLDVAQQVADLFSGLRIPVKRIYVSRAE